MIFSEKGEMKESIWYNHNYIKIYSQKKTERNNQNANTGGMRDFFLSFSIISYFSKKEQK